MHEKGGNNWPEIKHGPSDYWLDALTTEITRPLGIGAENMCAYTVNTCTRQRKWLRLIICNPHRISSITVLMKASLW